MSALRIAVVGNVGSVPYAGMAWMTMQIAVGLERIGHHVRYLETTTLWPYDPKRGRKVCDPGYAVPYLQRVTAFFGMGERWAYRASYADGAWLGPCAAEAAAFLAGADLVLNIACATSFARDGIATGRLVSFNTDPVFQEIRHEQGDAFVHEMLDEHHDVVTYGENIGNADCPLKPLPRLRATTRQPVLLDRWESGAPTRDVFTTVGNWKQQGRDIEFRGERYLWSKHHEFRKFMGLPRRTRQRMEIATNLAPAYAISHSDLADVTASGFSDGEYETLEHNRWRLVDGPAMSMAPAPYRDYIVASRAEFTVARDLNVRLKSGWFSERSACYLAAGRPVVTQDTGFGCALPLGEGLFAVSTEDEALAAIEAINADYARHSRAARDIAHEYFRAETVLARLVDALG